jgi:hypothetical protein
MRLARPTCLVDILRLDELAGVRTQHGVVVIGATTRQADVEHDPLIATNVPLLARVMPFIGHKATRTRGTIGGSIAAGMSDVEVARRLANVLENGAAKVKEAEADLAAGVITRERYDEIMGHGERPIQRDAPMDGAAQGRGVLDDRLPGDNGRASVPRLPDAP